MLKVIVFDFDGVIVDSNHIKRNAYYSVFSSLKGSKELIKNVLFEFEPNTRIFIIAKIIDRLIEKGLINSKDKAKYKDEFVKRYGNICEKEILTCNKIRGASGNIKKLSKRFHLYINSLTPTASLTRILKGRGLLKYFNGIFGGEKSKLNNLKKIIFKEKISPPQLLIIGDSVEDLKVAKDCGTNFIGIDNGEGILKKANIDYFLKDCRGLYKTVKKICERI